MIKITPVLMNGQPGKAEVQETTMDNACKQCAHYVNGTDIFKFFVVTQIHVEEK